VPVPFREKKGAGGMMPVPFREKKGAGGMMPVPFREKKGEKIKGNYYNLVTVIILE
jgi:hypothetical protein